MGNNHSKQEQKINHQFLGNNHSKEEQKINHQFLGNNHSKEEQKINHQFLGNKIDLYAMKAKAIDIMNIIWINESIQKKKRNMSEITTIMPHAGPKYVGLYNWIYALQHDNKIKKPIIYFDHGNPQGEHSYENVKYYFENSYGTMDQPTNFHHPSILSTDLTHGIFDCSDEQIYHGFDEQTIYGKKVANACGQFNLQRMKDLTMGSKIHLHSYWNSRKSNDEKTVTYAIYSVLYRKKDVKYNYFQIFESKLLAYRHLKVLVDFFRDDSKMYIDDELFWSPLQKIEGHIFITIENGKEPITCFGDWDGKYLLQSLKNASRTIKQRKWEDNGPITSEIFQEQGKTICVSIIQPIDQWVECVQEPQKNIGYGYMDEKKLAVKAIFLPSVWNREYRVNPQLFFDNLKKKANATHQDKLMRFDSVSWNMKII